MALVATLYYLGVTASYVWLVAEAIRVPVTPGHDGRWALLLAGCAALAIGAQLVAPRYRVTRAGVLAAIAVGIVMVVASGQVIAALVTAWLFVLAGLCGDAVLRVLGARGSRGLERAVVSVPLGLVALALVGLSLAALGVFRFPWVAGTLGSLTIALLILERSRLVVPKWTLQLPSAESPLLDRALVLLLVVTTLIALTWALVPEVEYDALNYHLAVPRDYVTAGRLVDLPYYWHSYFAQMAETIFGIGLALHGLAVVRLVVFGIAVLAAGAAYVLGVRLFSPRVALWATAVFCTTPSVVRLATTADVDMLVAVMLLAMGVSMAHGLEGRRPGWLFAGAILAGGAVAVKITGIYGVAAAGTLVLWRLLVTSRERLHGAMLAAALVSVMLAVASPWYIVRYSLKGNPFYPFFEPAHPTVAGAAHYLHSKVTATEVVSRMSRDRRHHLILPVRFTYQTRDFSAFPDGVAGVTLMLFPVAVGATVRARRSVRTILAVALVYLTGWIAGFPHARIFVPILPLLALVCASAMLERSRPHAFAGSVLLFVLVASQVVLTPAQFWQVPERVPVATAFGLESQRAFLARTIPPYAAIEFLNARVRPGERVFGIGIDGARYYLHAPLSSFVETIELLRLLGTKIPASDHPVVTDYSYLVMNRDAMGGRRVRDPFRIFPFLAQHTWPVFSHRNTTVYELSNRPRSAPVILNVLKNPGFDAVAPGGTPEGWTSSGSSRVERDQWESPPAGGDLAFHSQGPDAATQRVRAVPGEIYGLSQSVRADATGQQARLQINWLDADGAIVDVTLSLVPVFPDWRRHRVYATAPPGASIAEVYAGAHGGSTVYFDEMAFGPIQ